MIDDGILGGGAVPWLRDHWVDHVRGRGPFRPGESADQPYGILPVLCGIAVDPATPEEYLEVVLRTTRTFRDQSIPDVTRLRLESPDSDRDLVQALATLPHPERFAVRGVVGRSTLNALAQELSEPWDGWQFTLPGVRSFINALFLATGASGRPQLLDVVYTDGSREWVGPLVTARPLSDTGPLIGNYLNWMAKATPAQLINENHPFEKNTLLYVLARRSGRLDSGGAASLQRFRSAATHLATLPTATLEQLLRETLGTCAYRLDAWETSLATRQLGINRARVEADKQRVGGIQIGRYGWVEDLVARPASRATSPDHLRRSGQRGLRPRAQPPARDDRLGAPERLAQPRRRPGHAHGRGPLLGARARRVRAARRRAERSGAGRAARLPVRTWPARGPPGRRAGRVHQRVPGAGTASRRKAARHGGPGAQPTAQAAPAVVDGLKLLDLWRTRTSQAGQAAGYHWPGGVEARTAAEAELQALAEAVDSVADAAMAEGLHHLLQGNLERAGTITEAVSSGELPPPNWRSQARAARGAA